MIYYIIFTNGVINALSILSINPLKNEKKIKFASFNKVALSMFIALSLVCIFFACRKSVQSENEIIDQITAKELSSVAGKLGLNSINRLSTSNENTQEFSLTGRSVIVNGYKVSFANVRLSVEKTVIGYDLSLSIGKKLINYTLNESTRKAYKKTLNGNVSMETILSNEKEEVFFLVAMVIFSETQNNPQTRYAKNNKMAPLEDYEFTFSFAKFEDGPPVAAACERTVASIHYTSTSATAGVTSATDRFLKEHPDCQRKGSVDSGCLWGSYACVATQSITCSGGGCDVPYGQFDTEYPDTTPVAVDTSYDEPVPTQNL